MVRKVFFSFHYQRDVWRVGQVRNSWLTKKGESNTFMDKADWEKVKLGGDAAIKKWIDQQLNGTSVTVVLIGSETHEREYVLHEIKRSWELGKGVIGIYIHDLKDQNGDAGFFTPDNPFEKIRIGGNIFFPITLADKIPMYHWKGDNGYKNMPTWIEDSATQEGY